MSDSFEPPGDQIRASDADRRRTTERLERAVETGELTPDEESDRAVKAGTAVTRGELAELTKDLAPDPVPEAQPWQRTAATPAPYERRERRGIAHLAARWRSWAGSAVVLTAIWGWTSIAAGHLTYYWPVWPLGMWAAALAVSAVRGSDKHD